MEQDKKESVKSIIKIIKNNCKNQELISKLDNIEKRIETK